MSTGKIRLFPEENTPVSEEEDYQAMLNHGYLFRDRGFRRSLAEGFGAVGMAVLSVAAAQWHLRRTAVSPIENDLVLDALPDFPFPLTLLTLLVWGAALFTASLFVMGFRHLPLLPAALKTAALLYFLRSVFLIMTPLAAHPGKLSAEPLGAMAGFLYGGSDLFFSGHVALPSLAAFLFWERRGIRRYCLAAAIFFGGASLLAKSHYTIDVAAAPFISYGVYALARRIFRRDFGCSQPAAPDRNRLKEQEPVRQEIYEAGITR